MILLFSAATTLICWIIQKVIGKRKGLDITVKIASTLIPIGVITLLTLGI